MTAQKASLWFYNSTSSDIVLSELNVVIKHHDSIDLFKSNPNLTLEMVERSRSSGALSRLENAKKLVKLSGPPVKEKAPPKYIESKTPFYSKIRSVIEIDPHEKNFVDQLEEDFMRDNLEEERQVAATEKFLKKIDLDGFSDPLKDLMDE